MFIILANASIDKLSSEQIYLSTFYFYFFVLFFPLVLWKGFLKLEYKSDQEGENTYILVKTAGLFYLNDKFR